MSKTHFPRLVPLCLPSSKPSLSSFSSTFQALSKMAAFSYQHPPFLFDSSFFPNNSTSSIKMTSPLFDQPNNFNNSSCFSQIFPSQQPLDETPASVGFHENETLSKTHLQLSDNEPCVTEKQSTDSSMVDNKRKTSNGSSFNSASSKEVTGGKGKRQRKCNGVMKEVEEKKPKANTKKEEKKSHEEAKTGYIHVRARRGQATDSHSLAERVRREKISERMKLLQDLVPGCDKVTGKALMLDEIINYVQSLQNQVEFLSMKLASVNPLFYDFGMDLDAVMVRPERLSSLNLASSPQQALADTATTFTSPHSYPLMDSSAVAFLIQQGQTLNTFTQGEGNLLTSWHVDEQRQKMINQSGFASNLHHSLQ